MQIIESSSVAGVINLSFDLPSQEPRQFQHIVFPDFQRPYCWTLNDIQKILDDIDELRYSPEEERYREEDEYYLGAICIMPLSNGKAPELLQDIALLDGQQRLTSLMIMAHILYERAMTSSKVEIRTLGEEIDTIMGKDLAWKRTFLYREPATQRRISQIYFAVEREYRQLAADAALDDVNKGTSLSFYEETLLRDLRRFRYILLSGRLAITQLNNLKEAEQYFQGENNRGLPMSLLDILKAYHMRFETDSGNLQEIRRIWSVFNDPPISELDNKTQDEKAEQAETVLAQRKKAVETHVIPALLMRCGIEPWSYSANRPENAQLLKGIIGTHRRDRIVDKKLSVSSSKRLFDLIEPVQTGINFFRMIDQYRRIDEAIDTLESSAQESAFNPAFGLNLNYDQRLILRLALIAWVDRFAPNTAFDKDVSEKDLAEMLARDAEFRSYARHFARFLERLRYIDDTKPGAFKRLDKSSLLRCIRYWDTRTNLLLLPHRLAAPAACKREFLNATTPEAMASLIRNDFRNQNYESAYKLEAAAEAFKDQQNSTGATDHE